MPFTENTNWHTCRERKGWLPAATAVTETSARAWLEPGAALQITCYKMLQTPKHCHSVSHADNHWAIITVS